MENHTYPLEGLFGRILSPFEQFLRRTSAGGIVLIVTTFIALGLAAWLGGEPIQRFWGQSATLAAEGIDLRSVGWSEVHANSVTVGVLTGLVIGKFVGISLFSWIAVRLGLARLPSGVQWRYLLGAAWLGGIGFTMSLFIAQLAFRNPEFVEPARLGILLGSAISAGIGLIWLYLAGSGRGRPTSHRE